MSSPATAPEIREEFSEALPHTAAARGGCRVDRVRFAPLIQQASRVGWIRPLLPVLIEWSAIVGLMVFAIGIDTWWGYGVAGVLMAGRQMGLSVMTHEAAHRRLSPSGRVNNWVGDLLCALPVGMSLTRFRRSHLTHHRHLSTEEDPDFASMAGNPQFHFPMLRARFLRVIGCDLLGLNARNVLRYLQAYRPFGPGLGWRSWIFRAGRTTNTEMVAVDRVRALLVVAMVAGLFAVLPAEIRLRVALLWLVPYCSVYVLLLRLRSISDHSGLADTNELDATRHVTARWWERLFLPWNINVHIAHHLFPSVPQYRLGEIHRRIMEDPELRAQAHVTQGYGLRGVIGELTNPTEGPTDSGPAVQHEA